MDAQVQDGIDDVNERYAGKKERKDFDGDNVCRTMAVREIL